MSGESTVPAISVVLPTTSDFDSIATTVRYLRAQSIADRLELVVVPMAQPGFTMPDAASAGLCGTQVMFAARKSHGDACAQGVLAARAPVVVFAEDHCFPEPGWAAALLAAYTSEQVAAVGPVFRNANPSTLVSWCDFVIGYGPWLDPHLSGDQPFLAGHNSSYRRDLLIGLGPRLAESLESETVLHLELRSQGWRLLVTPDARASHTNFGRIEVWLPVQYHCGRVFASERARTWGWARRMFYAAASPLIPGVRFLRAVRHLRRAEGHRPSLLRLGPLLALGLVADGIGQLVGYVAGGGASSRHLTGFEFRRMDFVPDADRHLWTEAGSHA